MFIIKGGGSEPAAMMASVVSATASAKVIGTSSSGMSCYRGLSATPVRNVGIATGNSNSYVRPGQHCWQAQGTWIWYKDSIGPVIETLHRNSCPP